MTHIRGYTLDHGSHRWQHRGMGRHADLASQDDAQKIQRTEQREQNLLRNIFKLASS